MPAIDWASAPERKKEREQAGRGPARELLHRDQVGREERRESLYDEQQQGRGDDGRRGTARDGGGERAGDPTDRRARRRVGRGPPWHRPIDPGRDEEEGHREERDGGLPRERADERVRDERDRRRPGAPGGQRRTDCGAVTVAEDVREDHPARRPVEPRPETEERTAEDEQPEGGREAHRDDRTRRKHEGGREQRALAEVVRRGPGGELHQRVGRPDDRDREARRGVADAEVCADVGEDLGEEIPTAEDQKPAGGDHGEHPAAAVAAEPPAGRREPAFERSWGRLHSSGSVRASYEHGGRSQ